MAFTYTISENRGYMGSDVVLYGTYFNTAGSTGGVIDTGSKQVDFFNSNNSSQSATTNQVAISGGIVTLTTVANESGQFIAFVRAGY